jgi:hypothetical protein
LLRRVEKSMTPIIPLAVVAGVLMTAAATEQPAMVVQAEGSPVRIERATILTGTDGPPVVLYAATNLTDDELDQFTLMAFTFDAKGMLKARQLAPARRTLEARTTKYSTMVLDGAPIEATDIIVVGVNQAQRVGSDVWWRADLQPVAEAAARKTKP